MQLLYLDVNLSMLDDMVDKCHATALIGCGLVHVGRHGRLGSFFSFYCMWTYRFGGHGWTMQLFILDVDL